MIEDLSAVREDIVSRLGEAARSRRSAMHTPVVVTPDADARIMVLREFDAASWTLRFHTDVRSPKASVIGSGADMAVLFYDAEAKLQIRCRGRGHIESDTPLAEKAWADSTAFARRCYLGAGPGEERDEPSSGLPDWAEGAQPTEEDLVPARKNFGILLVRVETADWYCLSHKGHRRALITPSDGQWLTP
ncbi:flavin-binding protein [Qipengyuania xiapuensis]|nr:flavin-binding protein [Qipengyuania xiapuensis]